MDFKVNCSLFINAMSDINKVISSRNVIPILAGIKIEANKNGLTLTGSNSDVVIERTIPSFINEEKVVEISEFGSVVVLSKYLNELIKKLPDDIHMKADFNGSVTIKSGTIETRLNGFDSNEYPKLPEMDRENNVKVPFGKLTEAIKQTVFAVAKSESRPVLTGVKMEFEQNKLICTATDSHRLARREVHIQSDIQESFIVPSTSLSELMHLKESESSTLDIYYTNSFIVFKTANSSLYSRLIEGSFPNVQALVPSESKSTVTINTKALMEGIDRACVFSTEWKNNNVNLEIVNDARIKIASNATEVGMIEEYQKIIEMDGQDDIQMTFDGRFMLDALKGIQEENVTISFGGMMKPIVIKPQHSGACLHLISPLRTY
ncbi:DNA polymerase III subunit beta [Sporosarcina beigongshangi]|uniref:DNA polymerase III subunit beta n=1 Tax=Sporosarcina beigongshangi TaxID=2782538 RepID=UPI00193A1ACB|nr:DNA polymerase III subunit beta [Sporosarcina beigongshangi]